MSDQLQKVAGNAILLALAISMSLTACKFRQTSFATKSEANAACNAWRSEGKKITMKINVIEGGRSKTVKIKTYNRECWYDSSKREYGGYEIKDFSGAGATNNPDKAYKVKQFRIEQRWNETV